MRLTLSGSKKLLTLLSLFALAGLLGACNGGGGGGAAGSCGSNLGTLPNGSTVSFSAASFDIAPGGSEVGSIQIIGGTKGATFELSFGNAQPDTPDSGVSIVPSPNPCSVGTAGTGLPTSCPVTVYTNTWTATNNYTVPVIATYNNGESTVTLSCPVTVMVSSTSGQAVH